MKKRFCVALLTLLALSFIVAPIASAAVATTQTCKIAKVASDLNGVVRFYINNVNGEPVTEKNFIAPVGEERTMLAMGMAAITQDMDVEITVVWAANGSVIQRFRLVSN